MPDPSIDAEGEKEYIVTFPLVGSISFVVQADSAENAKARAYDVEWRLALEGDAELNEIEMLEHVTRGNVCYAPHPDVEVIES